MVKYKVVFTGPVGAGKTTAINAVTDQKLLTTDAPVTDITKERKETTTVAMDYGVISLGSNEIIHLYGTPGQERFDFMWDILAKGAHGLILLLDNSRNYPYRDLKLYLTSFAELIANVPLVIGVTRFETHATPPLEAYKQWIREFNLTEKIVAVDARKKDDVLHLLNLLLYPDDEMISESFPIADTPEINEKNEEASFTPKSKEIIYEAEETMKLTEDSLKQVEKIRGVNGVTLTNDMGELLHSTIEDDALNEFVAFLSGLMPTFEDDLEMGKIHRIMLRGPKDDNLTVFVEEEHSLGVSSERRVSVPALSQQVEDMLQWG